jgi:hypothetical protein
MANVTFGTPAAQRLQGNFIVRIFVVNGASGSTLPTNMSNILWAGVQSFCQAGTASLITGVAVNATTGVITFTSSAPMVNEVVMVWATKG